MNDHVLHYKGDVRDAFVRISDPTEYPIERSRPLAGADRREEPLLGWVNGDGYPLRVADVLYDAELDRSTVLLDIAVPGP